ncbi:NAD(P)H-dependent oxidoreductase [Candidatus Lariskella endosymbiont of Epinotia ramella]|uniref:NADPH-dependent FMN reductase n=1 Tax=Candidatus Lariskella endosymbiont of Epinotia ramella TaxID=3066224 RepID=UPI0030D39A95
MGEYMKILAFAGSIRSGSLTEHVLDFALDNIRKKEGYALENFRLADFDIPMFNDIALSKLERNADILKLLEMTHSADAILIACPEYNGSIPGCLKNLIDWLSFNIFQEEGYIQPFVGKICGVLSASPSQFGAVRAVLHLHDILVHLKSVVMPEYLCLPRAAVGKISESDIMALHSYSNNFINFIRKHKS